MVFSKGSQKVAAFAASIALAISPAWGGVVIADELVDQSQTTAVATTDEQEMSAQYHEENPTAEDTAYKEPAREMVTSEQHGESGEGLTDGMSGDADEKSGEEAKDKNEMPADEDESDATAEDATETNSNDLALTAQAAEIHHIEDGGETVVDESEFEWVPVDTSKYSSDKYRYIDEDGYRIFFESAESIELPTARFKIGENGELLKPIVTTGGWQLSTAHTFGNFDGQFFWSVEADVAENEFTPYPNSSGYYYEGGEYGPRGYYRYNETTGMYMHSYGGVVADVNTSSSNENGTTPLQESSYEGYMPSTVTLTPATGRPYVSASEASSIPATSDVTSFVGAMTAALGALAAFGSAKVIRRK